MNLKRKTLYLMIFNITFFIGYVCRVMVFGWLMFILLIPEYIFRSFYYFIGVSFFDRELTQKTVGLNSALQVFYLLTSLFSYDGGDQNTYTFAHLWINPPEKTIQFLWFSFASITIILMVASIVDQLKQRKGKIDIARGMLKLLVGCVAIPLAAFFTGTFLMK